MSFYQEETYADISPVRLDSNGVSGFISIMRGCDNMFFCVVPFTRGRESRSPLTIVAEAKQLYDQGYKVTLLGQNVDSYRWNIKKERKLKKILLQLIFQNY